MPPDAFSFVLTGGGTGGHVFPALAVARVLRDRGHRLLFIGTENGIESKLVPEAGFGMSYVRSGGLNRVGFRQQLQTAAQLPLGTFSAWRQLRRFRAQAVFSMGGYAAGPVMIAAVLARIPLIVMEPNIVPGIANRKVARFVYRALVGFDVTARFFGPERSEVTGLPVRSEFFRVQRKTSPTFTVLITGGSRGARTLNAAARASWRFFRESGPIRFIHQTGKAEYDAILREFTEIGLEGEIVPFLADMADAFSRADLVIARAGAGSVNEIAAAGMASVLIPFPFAADDHQRKNAEALAAQGAARLVLDTDWTGERMYDEVENLRCQPALLSEMRIRVRRFAHQGAAERAADIMEQAAKESR